MVGLAYAAEHDEELSRWMLDNDVNFGEYADGGPGRLETIRRSARVIESAQLAATAARQSRSRREVFDSLGWPVQRIA